MQVINDVLANRTFILEHFFTSKLFAATREAFSNAYSDKEVRNMAKIKEVVIKNFGSQEVLATGNVSCLGLWC
jgi:hypothetical protein